MLKTQIQLEAWQHAQLKRLGQRQSRSIADLVRESVTALLRRSAAGELEDLRNIAGKYRATDFPEPLKDHDRGWAEAIR